MKQAFEANLPRVKPRVRFNIDTNGHDESVTDEIAKAPVVASSVNAQELAQQVLRSPLPAPEVEDQNESEAPPPVKATARKADEHPVAPPPRMDADASVLRREKLRSRLRSLSAGAALKPAGSAEGVLAAAEDLVQQLDASHVLNARLESELKGARRDLERAAADAEQATQERERLLVELAEARGLLESVELELAALESERDEVLHEVRAQREAESARAEGLRSLSTELDEARREIAEKQSEQEEILSELQQSDADRARLRLEVRRLEEERARTLQELEATAVAEGELREQRGTLSRVQQVLAAARKR